MSGPFKPMNRLCAVMMVLTGLLLPAAAQAGSYEDFFRAIVNDRVAPVRDLVVRGFDPNTRDERGEPALVAAIRADAPAVSDYLAELPQLDINLATASDENALMLAAYHKRADLAVKILERGAEVNKPGWTALHYAAGVGDEKIVQLLLEHSAYIDADSPNHTTPLMFAVRERQDAIARLLVTEGADPTLVNQAGLSAADYARRNEDTEMAAWLEQQAKDFRQRSVPHQ